MNDKAREARVRREFRRQGLMICKDRARSWSLDHQGGYRIIDPYRNAIVDGARYEFSLEDLEQIALSG